MLFKVSLFFVVQVQVEAEISPLEVYKYYKWIVLGPEPWMDW